MGENKLVPGEPRLGWFVDGNADTPRVAVMLRDTGSAIELTVPLQGMSGRDDPYARWWSGRVMYVDDPDRTRHSYAPPRQLLVEDVDGPVVLVGCRTTGSTSNFSTGRGRIVANFAVIGGRHLRYDKVNALRTDIPALAAWTQLGSMNVSIETNEKRRVSSVQMKLNEAEPVRLNKRLNLSMRSTWRIEQPFNSFAAYEAVEVETSVVRPRGWDEHLEIHGAVLDLVSIAAWRPFGMAATKVLRTDDPVRALSGDELHERWSTVVTHRLPKHEDWKEAPRFLFPWAEVGPTGVTRWLSLRTTYARAIHPLLRVLRSDDPWGHGCVVQSGICLEMLAYLIDVEKNDGANLNSWQQMNFKQGLQVILEDLGMKPFDDIAGWIERAHATYMGAKHPDRPEPDSLVMLNTLRENLLIVRCWIGRQLGVSVDSLRSGLQNDRLTNEFVAID